MNLFKSIFTKKLNDHDKIIGSLDNAKDNIVKLNGLYSNTIKYMNAIPKAGNELEDIRKRSLEFEKGHRPIMDKSVYAQQVAIINTLYILNN